jgi:H+/Cl- antiporter ClcA
VAGLLGATKLPPRRGAPTSSVQAGRNEAFVAGGFGYTNDAFSFTGFREREWLPGPLDPDRILKPRLTGQLASTDQATSMTYQIDARNSCKCFFALFSLAILFVILGLVLTLVRGVSVPGGAFFAFLLVGVCLVFLNGIWKTVPKAQADEAYLEAWLMTAIQADRYPT